MVAQVFRSLGEEVKTFSNGAQIVHTIAAPGSEFQVLKQISLQGVFTRIYTIDGQHAVEGKVRGLVNSFRDNTKASEIFREAKIYDIGKESKSVSPLTWEDHALANNTREQEFLRRKIQQKRRRECFQTTISLFTLLWLWYRSTTDELPRKYHFDDLSIRRFV